MTSAVTTATGGSGPAVEEPGTSLLRRALITLAAVGALGAAADLGVARHWQTPIQFVPWATLGVLAAGIAVLAIRPGRRAVAAVRVLAFGVAGASAFGVYEHIAANYAVGPLDARYSATWATMSPLTQWWTAASGGVGPSPSLAPGVLGYAALCLFFATLRHPSVSQSHARPG